MNETTYRLSHQGSGGELFAIFIVNALLTIVTLGIYRFWAKTRVRRYLWSHSSIAGERLEYTGTGKELFLGFLVAMAFLVLGGLLIFFLSTLLADLHPLLAALPWLLLYVALLTLPLIGIYSARRYTLSRTRWRGIRFAQSGSALRYAALGLGLGLLSILTLGLYTPFARARLTRYTTDNTWFGSQAAQFSGTGRALFGRFALALLLTLPTLGLYWFWYAAAEARYFAEQTGFQGAQLASTITGGALLKLAVTNLLLLVFTLGLAYPWVVVRTVRLYAEHYTLKGAINFAALAQSTQRAPRTGEGLVEAFGMGGI